MKQSLLLSLVVIFSLTHTLQAQLSMSSAKSDVLCHDDSNGTVSATDMLGCYAPISFMFDTMAPIVFDHLKNDGYKHINHGTGTAPDIALSVRGGMTSAGAVYIATGWFADSITFDSTTLYSAGGSGDRSMWVACFKSSNSELLWANRATVAGDWVVGSGVEIVGDKAYVVGYMVGSTQFGTQTVVSTGGYQGYIAKYDIASGALDTVVQVGNAGSDECTNIRRGPDDRLYVCGDFTGSITLGGTSYPTVGSYDLFITCFDTSLTTNFWGTTAGGPGIDVPRDLVASGPGGVVEHAYVVGYFQNPGITFGGTNLTSAGGYDFFVARADTGGNWNWAMGGGSTAADDCFTIDLNEDSDRLYVGGTFRSTMTYDGIATVSNGNQDGYIMYLDTNGTLDSLYQFGGVGFDGIYDLQRLEQDYLVFAGTHSNSWTFADSTFTTNGGLDGFIGKLGPDQIEIWGKNIGATSTSSGDGLNSLSVGPGTQLNVAGFIAGDASAYQSGLIAVGPSDVIVTNDEILGSIPDQFYDDLAAGDYVVMVNDALGNSLSDTLTVNNPDSILITGSTSSASSSSSNDGSITVTVVGGTQGYDYLWSNGDTTLSLDSVASGTYTITVHDANGCSSSALFVVDTLELLQLSFVASDVTCENTDNGSINLTVSGGTLPYTIAWNTGDTTMNLTGLASGTYTVTVSDSGSAQSVTESVVIASSPIHPDPIVGPITGATSVESFEEFSYSVPSTQGSAFLWSSAGGEVTASASNAASILWHAGPNGVVRVQETDVNGCIGMDSLEVNILFVGIDATPISEVSVYPNPTNGVLHFNLANNEQASVTVYNHLGSAVLTTKMTSATDQIDMSAYDAGIYTIDIFSVNGLSHTLKVILQ